MTEYSSHWFASSGAVKAKYDFVSCCIGSAASTAAARACPPEAFFLFVKKPFTTFGAMTSHEEADTRNAQR